MAHPYLLPITCESFHPHYYTYDPFSDARKEVAAVGDFDNDIEMIKWTGLGVAMGMAMTMSNKSPMSQQPVIPSTVSQKSFAIIFKESGMAILTEE